MFTPQYSAYGSASLSDENKPRKEKASSKMPLHFILTCCFVVPLLLFLMTFYIISFDVHYQSESFANMACCILLVVPLVIGGVALQVSKNNGDARPMALLCVMCIVAWGLGYFLGSSNFHANMVPFYNLNRMNVYPAVDPEKYRGTQVMDGGILEFTPGTRLGIEKSMGFKNGDLFCVAPIVAGKGKMNTSKVYDFWAVGLNCCSGHMPDFQCGEYANVNAMKGLRVMDQDKRDMFHLVAQKAAAEYNLRVSNPVFLHWLSEPAVEVAAYQDDGWGHFVTAAFSFVAAQILVIIFAAAMFAKEATFVTL